MPINNKYFPIIAWTRMEHHSQHIEDKLHKYYKYLALSPSQRK